MGNEVAFIALDSVFAVTHAVGNTMKRVVIILASVTVLQTPLTPLGWAGSTVAVLGTMVYSWWARRPPSTRRPRPPRRSIWWMPWAAWILYWSRWKSVSSATTPRRLGTRLMPLWPWLRRKMWTFDR